MTVDRTSRREFLRSSGSVFGAGWLALHWPQLGAAAAHAHAATTPGAEPQLRWLTPAQARDVEAIAAQIVPGGGTPGAREAGVVYFIDHVHGSAFAARAAAFQAGLAAFQAGVAEAQPGAGAFADLSPELQLAHLRRIEQTPFFADMRLLTILGLLALPSYGGNRDRVGWRLVGFDDRHVWEPPFGHYDADYAGFQPYPTVPRT